MAELVETAGYYMVEDLLDTLVAERDHLYNLSLLRKGVWAEVIRKKIGFSGNPVTISTVEAPQLR